MTEGKTAPLSLESRRIGFALWVAALVFGLAADAAAQRAGAAPEILTNQSVISMTGAKLNKDLLLTKVNTTRNAFDVTVNGIVNLYQAKVHADVIRSMITMAVDPKLGQPSKNAELLDNQSVVTMIVAKVPKAIVLSKIQNTKSAFDVSASGLVGLTQSKVPADVIKTMVVKSGSD
jgi:hypothetical protein